MDSHISWLLRTHVTPAQCHLQSGSLPQSGMCHFANAHMHTLHFKLRRAESLENASNRAIPYTQKKKSQTWALSLTIREDCMARIYEVVSGLELA